MVRVAGGGWVRRKSAKTVRTSMDSDLTAEIKKRIRVQLTLDSYDLKTQARTERREVDLPEKGMQQPEGRFAVAGSAATQGRGLSTGFLLGSGGGR